MEAEMTAYKVTNNHVDLLISYGVSNEVSFFHDEQMIRLSHENMDEAASLLHWQNEKSLKDRYKHWYSDEPRRAFKLVDTFPEAVAILKLCESYETNSGTVDYPMSIAAAIIKAIRSRAIKGLAGYHEAPWVIE
ncbi:MAG TPA: hypothetical protein DEQ40_06995 [Oxalobacteraceae bacterium]|jgi:hypothetical protein|nr:hypothetical protein [Oxalobacteraceae bacterium]